MSDGKKGVKTKAAALCGTVVFLFLALTMLLGDDSPKVAAFEYRPEAAAGLQRGDPAFVRAEAATVADRLFGAGTGKSRNFQDRLLRRYAEVKENDVLILFNSGGWGKTALADVKDDWDTVADGIGAWLASHGYRYKLIEYKRSGGSVPDIVLELKEFATARYTEAYKQAAEAHFLTTAHPNLKIILLGESSGAMFSNDVMRLLEGNPRVLSIQAGQPFWDDDVPGPATLAMNYNGKSPDSLHKGDIWAMFKHNFVRLTGIFRPGNFVKLDDTITAPGHHYGWGYPLIREQINQFLEANLGRGGS